MVTPFSGGGKTPTNNIIILSGGVASVSGTSQLSFPVTRIDWSLITNTPYFQCGFQHDAASTAAGGMKVILRDMTNNTNLLVFSSNTTSVTNTDGSTILSVFTTFAKPAGFAKVAIQVQNNDSTVRSVGVSNPRIIWL